MNDDANRMQVSLEQIGLLIRAIEDLKENVLPKDPKLFAVLAEGPLDQMSRIRQEIDQYVGALKPTA